MKHGDQYLIKCPHCDHPNVDVTEGRSVPIDATAEFVRPCSYCKRDVYYLARWSLLVTASETR